MRRLRGPAEEETHKERKTKMEIVLTAGALGSVYALCVAKREEKHHQRRIPCLAMFDAATIHSIAQFNSTCVCLATVARVLHILAGLLPRTEYAAPIKMRIECTTVSKREELAYYVQGVVWWLRRA